MHPEADAFLDAIFDHPDDDTPRLVYADWLQEHGHEDYAQFIRLSVKADGGSKPPRVRQELREERLPYWQRMQERTEAFQLLPVTIHDYDRGICTKVTAKADTFVATAATWWPFITPPELTVFDLTGSEATVVELIGQHLPQVSKLRCLSRVGMDVHDIDEYYFAPLNPTVFTEFTCAATLPRLRSLKITIAWADLPALRAFAESELVTRLESLWIEVRFRGTDKYEHIIADVKEQPTSIRLALQSFFDRRG